MARSHKVDIGGLMGGGRQVLVVDDLIPIEEFEGTRFPDPAVVHLEMRYIDHLLHIEGAIDVRAEGPCDSCLEDIVRSIHADVDERFDPHPGSEGDPFGENNVLTGDRLDVADLAQQLVLSAMPMGLRCGDDCKGLCGTCGTNLNASACSCVGE